MNALLLAWVHGVGPAEQRPGHTYTCRYIRAADDGPEQREITITLDDVRERWAVDGQVREDLTRTPLPYEQPVDVWLSEHHAALEADGWELAEAGMVLDLRVIALSEIPDARSEDC